TCQGGPRHSPYQRDLPAVCRDHSGPEIAHSGRAAVKGHSTHCGIIMSVSSSNSSASEFPHGLVQRELQIGVVSSVSAQMAKFNLSEAGSPSAAHLRGGRYGRGEVGEFVLVEGQTSLLLGRIVEVRLPERDRRSVNPSQARFAELD